MKHLIFSVNNQTLQRHDNFKPAANSVEYLTASFTFSADWSGTAKTAKCRKGDSIYTAVIGSDGVCKIPFEVLIQDSNAKVFGKQNFYISVEGVKGTLRITTDEITIPLSCTATGNEENAGDPTADVFSQFVAEVEAATKENADAATEAAASATASAASMKNDYANALKGNASGGAICLDDVSPVEHYPSVKVHGKNLISSAVYDMANWALVGETTNNYVFPLTLLKDGNTYTISAEILDNSFGYFYIEKSANGFITNTDIYLHFPNSSAFPYTFEKEKGYEYRLFWYDDNHTFSEFATRLQIESGEAATEYETWIEPTAVTLKRYGKAVFAANEYELATATAYAWSSILMAKIKLPHGIYTASCKFRQKGEKARVALSLRDYDDHAKTLQHTDSQAIDGTLKATFEVKDDNKGFQMFLYSNYSENKLSTDCIFSDIQVECGAEATGYEQYKGIEYTPNAEGVIEGLTSLSPTMTLLTDTEGVTIECEYNRDINAVVAKLEKLLSS